jgi:hypothetical protein
MFLAAPAVLVELQAVRIVAPVLLGGVIPLFTVITLKGNDRADVLLLRSHSDLAF